MSTRAQITFEFHTSYRASSVLSYDQI